MALNWQQPSGLVQVLPNPAQGSAPCALGGHAWWRGASWAKQELAATSTLISPLSVLSPAALLIKPRGRKAPATRAPRAVAEAKQRPRMQRPRALAGGHIRSRGQSIRIHCEVLEGIGTIWKSRSAVGRIEFRSYKAQPSACTLGHRAGRSVPGKRAPRSPWYMALTQRLMNSNVHACSVGQLFQSHPRRCRFGHETGKVARLQHRLKGRHQTGTNFSQLLGLDR